MTVTNSPATTAYDNLVQLVHSLRPSWQGPGIKAAVREVCSGDRQVTFEALTFAVVAIALDESIRTPGALSFDGPHWSAAGVTGTKIPPEWDWQPRQSWPAKKCGAGPSRGPRCDLDAGHVGKCDLGVLRRDGFPQDGECATCHYPPHACTSRHPEDPHEFVARWEERLQRARAGEATDESEDA